MNEQESLSPSKWECKYHVILQISKWGNSLAVRLPAAVVDALELKEGDEIEIHVAERYNLSTYDAMIVASALQAGCDTLWSEDMQHGMEFGERLRIVNPFRYSHLSTRERLDLIGEI